MCALSRPPTQLHVHTPHSLQLHSPFVRCYAVVHPQALLNDRPWDASDSVMQGFSEVSLAVSTMGAPGAMMVFILLTAGFLHLFGSNNGKDGDQGKSPEAWRARRHQQQQQRQSQTGVNSSDRTLSREERVLRERRIRMRMDRWVVRLFSCFASVFVLVFLGRSRGHS